MGSNQPTSFVESGSNAGMFPKWVAKVVTTGLIAITWIYIILRSRPMPDNDYQAFLLVGSRLAQGDRLYVDVWDNKDPLTHWIAALVSQSFPLSSHVVELIWLATVAIATFFIARAFGTSPIVASLAGGVLGPLAILNLAYFQGATELPGITITLASLALVMRRHFVFSGALLGVLVFLKIVFLPVALTAVLYWLFTSKHLKSITRISLGFLSAFLSLLILLFARGELLGYFETLRMNMQYSNAQLEDGVPMQVTDAIGSRISLITQHQMSGSILIALILFAISYLVIFKFKVTNPEIFKSAWILSALSFVTTFAVLFITAKLSHHVLLMAVPVILTSLMAISIVENFHLELLSLSKSWRVLIASLFTLILSIVATGVMAPLDHKFLAESGWDRINTEIQVSDAEQWLKINPELANVPIGFLGRGRSVPITGTDVPWELACRFTGQGPTSADLILDETLECLTRSEIIIIGVDAVQAEEDGRYNKFLRDALNLVNSEYECNGTGSITVCRSSNSSTVE